MKSVSNVAGGISQEGAFQIGVALLDNHAELAIEPRVINVADFPADRAGNRLLTQSFAADGAM